MHFTDATFTSGNAPKMLVPVTRKVSGKYTLTLATVFLPPGAPDHDALRSPRNRHERRRAWAISRRLGRIALKALEAKKRADAAAAAEGALG